MSERLLTRREAADHLKSLGYPVAAATLAKLACLGGGPSMTHFGRKPLYRPVDLTTWAEGRCTRRRSTSEADGAVAGSETSE